MSSNQRSLSEVTLGDVLRGLARYRPFAIAVAAIVLAIAFLPGKPHHTSSSNVSSGNVTTAWEASSAAAAALLLLERAQTELRTFLEPPRF